MIEQIKNLSDIIFAVVGSVVAILTYRSAKETILQPVRTEVIKKQTDLLIDILALINNESQLIDKLDYHGLIRLNTFSSLLICGSIFSNHKEVEVYVKNTSRGGIFNTNDFDQEEYEIVPAFKENKIKQVDNYNKHFNAAKAGEFKISTVRLTKHFFDFQYKLNELANSPFIPLKIKSIISSLNFEINKNITVYLKKSVEDAINKSFEKIPQVTPEINGIYNNFNHCRLSHKNLILELYQESRKYLKIDSMP